MKNKTKESTTRAKRLPSESGKRLCLCQAAMIKQCHLCREKVKQLKENSDKPMLEPVGRAYRPHYYCYIFNRFSLFI